MPTATLIVNSDNNLEINFNDTMVKTNITETDLYVQIYGSKSEYDFTWTASYSSETKISIKMNINSNINGNKDEQVVVEFINSSNFKSKTSDRTVNPDSDLTDFLNQQNNEESDKAIGQTAMILFLVSICIAATSSFGGNSMEMMWGLMNTLQVMFFMSYINVAFPRNLDTFFTYLTYANANNVYLSEFSFLIIPEENFNQDEVNDKFGEESFYLNSSDKIPVLFLTVGVFAFTFIFDKLNLQNDSRVLRVIYKVVEYFKYNFFIRLGLEMFLELFMNAIINIYFVSFNV